MKVSHKDITLQLLILIELSSTATLSQSVVHHKSVKSMERGIDTATSILVAIGGYSGGPRTVKTVDTFDIPSATPLARIPDLPTPRSGLGAVTLVGLIFVIGGFDGSTNVATVDVYSPINGSWFSSTPMNVARYGLGACVLENNIYAIGGGGNSDGAILSSGEVFDPTARAWTPIASMGSPRYSHGVGVLDGFIFAVGGSDGVQSLRTVEKFEPKTNRWSTCAAMTSRRQFPAVSVVDGRLYAIGGRDTESGEFLASVELYDPKVDSWATAANMTTARQGPGAASIHGLIYVLGGFGPATWYLDSAEIFNTTENRWRCEHTMRLSRPRMNVAVTVAHKLQ